MQQSNMLKGLEIMKDYAEDNGGYLAAEHDIIYMACCEGPDEMNPEDVKALDELGFFWDEEFECWACYT